MLQMVGCPCTGATLNKFLQPGILVTLARGPMYGYRIAEELSKLPMTKGEKPDTTGLYRTLKSMEQRGLVASTWTRSAVGPDRRLYHLTGSGTACLRRWVQTLGEYHKAVGALFAYARTAYARSKRRGRDDK